MELSQDLLDLLASVLAVQGEGDEQAALTSDLVRLMHERRQARREPSAYSTASPPWYGLRPLLVELEDTGLITVEVGMASFVPPGAPTPIAKNLYVRLTPTGREAVRDASP